MPVPTLCFLKGINEIGACRACLVEVEGISRLVTACNNTCEEGMVIRTNTPPRPGGPPHQYRAAAEPAPHQLSHL